MDNREDQPGSGPVGSDEVALMARLAGGVAHSLNNLLTAISGYTEIQSQYAGGGESSQRNAREIRRGLDRATLLAQDLLALSRRLMAQPHQQGLATVAADVESLLQRIANPSLALELGHTIVPDPTLNLKGAETILLAEDDTWVRDLIQAALHTFGYTVLVAKDGLEALALGEYHPSTIHLLLTDVMMPGLKGPEVAARLAIIRPATRVLFMSGYADNLNLQYDLIHPSAAFIQKPFTPDALARKVREMLEM